MSLIQTFTRRHHLDLPDYDLKYKYVPPAFRFDLYKTVKEECEGSVGEYCLYRDASISINKENERCWTAEEMDSYYNPDFFVQLLQEVEWHEVLSLVEFFVSACAISADEVNELFAYHNVGYRYDSDLEYVTVHYDSLISDAEKVIESDIQYEGVIGSVQAAKEALIDPTNIRVAHSIKNSIDAVEGYLKGWLAERGVKANTLDEAIKILKKQGLCPVNIANSLEQYYILRHRTPNAGHGDPNVADLEQEDALLCLEIAISFINYFHRKKSKNA